MSNILDLIEPEYKEPVSAMYESAIGLDGTEKKKLKVFGTAIECDVVGINGRSYPKLILEPEVNRFMKKVTKGKGKTRGAAELNHPRLTSEGEGKDYSVFEMNLMKVCALIESLYFENNLLKCKMVVVETHPAGQALASLLEYGYVPGYSLRGAGSTVRNSKGIVEIAKDYKLITVDVVGNPSFDDRALIEPVYESIKSGNITILNESVERASMEFLHNVNYASRSLITGRKQYDKNTLSSYMRAISESTIRL